MTDEAAPPAARTTTIRVAAGVLEMIGEHARTALPDECCGLLLGDDAFVRLAWPARNELRSPTRYRVDPRDYLAAVRYGRRRGLDVVGAYHSHPESAAVPSRTDLAESAGERFLYVIAGHASRPAGPEVRAFVFGGGNFEELRIVAVPQEWPP